MFDDLKSVLGGGSDGSYDELVLARFQGVCEAFEQLKASIPAAWGRDSAAGHSQAQRAMVFYALATARMRRAEQLSTGLRDQARGSRAGIRADLQRLVEQLDLLTLATMLELEQPNATAGAWEQQHQLREAVNPPPVEEQGASSLAHARALYNGGLVLLTALQQALGEREQQPGAEALAAARLLLTQAQHIFNVLGPLAAELESNPDRFARPNAPQHEELRRAIERMVDLLERASAELAVPGVTQSRFWNRLVAPPPAEPHESSPQPAATPAPAAYTAAPQQQPAQPRRSPGYLIGMLLLAVLLVFCVLDILRGDESSSAALSDSGQASPTASEPPRNTLPPGGTPAPSGTLLLQDTFDDPATGWPDDANSNGSFHYRDGAYEVAVNVPTWLRWASTTEFYDELDLSIDVTLVAGPEAETAYGQVLREQDHHRCYMFEVRSDGSFLFGKALGDNEQGTLIWESLVGWQQTPAMRVGSAQTNRLRVVARGTTFELYINGQLVHRLEDAAYSTGSAGFVVESMGQPGGVVRFDNLELRAP